MIQCPGCGGRNSENALVCDWCARPFRNREPRFRISRTVALVAVVGVAMLVVAVGAVAVLTSSRASPSPGVTSSGAGATPIASAIAASPKPSAAASVTSVRPPSGPRQARVVNTGGQGALIRREPSVNAPSVALVPEDGFVRVLGPEETVQAQVWQQVDDGQGHQGWIRADFLVLIEGDMTVAPPP